MDFWRITSWEIRAGRPGLRLTGAALVPAPDLRGLVAEVFFAGIFGKHEILGICNAVNEVVPGR